MIGKMKVMRRIVMLVIMLLVLNGEKKFTIYAGESKEDGNQYVVEVIEGEELKNYLRER